MRDPATAPASTDAAMIAPPAREELLFCRSMRAPCHADRSCASICPCRPAPARRVPLRDVVNPTSTIATHDIRRFPACGTRLEWCGATVARGHRLEELFYIASRTSIDQAEDLLRQFGMLAIDEAAARSRHYRELGNAIRFCEWRQIERFLILLSQDVAVGTIH